MEQFKQDQATPEDFQIITSDEQPGFIAQLTNNKLTSYSSLKTDSMADKAKFYNVMNNPEKRVSEMIGKTIILKDVFVEVIELINQETGETSTCPRTVLIDDKGIGYQAVSVGVFSAIKKLFDVYGTPEKWTEPLPIEVRQISKNTRNILTFKIVE